MQGNVQRPGGMTQNQKLAAGLAAAGLAWYFYSKSQAENLGDAASRAGSAAGQKMEAAGRQVGSETLKEEGKGLQAKKQ